MISKGVSLVGSGFAQTPRLPLLLRAPGAYPASVETAVLEHHERMDGTGYPRGLRGPADSFEDRGLYDRCITRGVVGSMLPVIYGNSFQFIQSQGVVAIRYEMIHETRVIPLDGRPHVGQNIRQLWADFLDAIKTGRRPVSMASRKSAQSSRMFCPSGGLSRASSWSTGSSAFAG